jgi:hypothetical protein
LKGAFTGAVSDRRGKFELASGGTLFLDEVADMSLKTQAKVLRALQEQVVEPVGGHASVRVDVRILAATNKDLSEEIKTGRFREDLFFRLNVIPLWVPPLRDRANDVIRLAEHFISEFATEYGRRQKRLAPEAQQAMRGYRWPGNVRELRNVIERLMIMVPSETIEIGDLWFLEGQTEAPAARVPAPASPTPARRNLEDIRRGEFEGLAKKMANPDWAPDFGPGQPHPSAGASVVGARMPLIAYNINLATNRLDVAKKIAAAVRHSTGGLRFVKAMGIELADRGIVQVSMNLTNYEKTPIFRVFEMVKREAERYGVAVLESEIIGLVPQGALMASAAWYLQADTFTDQQVLENKLRQ